ncbi:hypothetical protein [Streptomyces sp. NPDC006463]|uniref:hypothetical protein n=1 Tax=Streptomyces sp. NPDC006463 TaxID=3364746 RepID=UPI00367A97E5
MEVDDRDAEDPGYRFHDLVRVFAHDQHETLPPEERRTAERRLVRAYRDAVVYLAAGRAPELGTEASAESAGKLDREAAGAWAAQESERIQWAITRARRLGLEAAGTELAEAFTYFLDDVKLSAETARWLFDAGAEQRARVVGSLRRGSALAALDNGMTEAALELFLTGAAADPVAPSPRRPVAPSPRRPVAPSPR